MVTPADTKTEIVPKPSERGPAEVVISGVGLALLFAVIFFSRITQVTDHDVFMHIRTGQWILENRAVPHADPFSWSAPGARWDDHEWLFQIFSYLLYRIGGFTALGLMRAGIMTFSLFLLYHLCRLRGGSARLSALLIAVAAIGVWPYNEARPYIITPLGLAIFGIALEHIRGGSRRWILVPPIFMLLWVNSHAGFTSGCILLMLAFAGAIAEEAMASVRGWFGPRNRNRKGRSQSAKHAPPKVQNEESPGGIASLLERYDVRVITCGLLTLAAVLCNPYGWRILLFPFKLVGNAVLMRIIQEWNPSTFEFESAFFYIMFILLGLRALTVIHRARPADLAAYVIFTLMALNARRHVSLFFFVLTPVAAAWLQPLLQWRPAQIRPLAWKVLHWVLILGFAAGWMIPVQASSRIWRFGNQPNPRIFIPKATELVRQYHLEPNMFNGYNLGGYYIFQNYPQYKVFIDGRADVYGPDLNQLYANLVYPKGPEWQRAFRDMNVNFVLMDSLLPGKRGLIDELAESRDWVLVYWDDVVSLYARDIPQHGQIIRERAFRLIHPLKVDENLVGRWTTPEEKAKGLRELERRAAEKPAASSVYRTLSFVYGRQGQLDKALDAANKFLEMMPNDAIMIARKGQIFEQMNRFNDAQLAYYAALGKSPDSGYLFTRLGVIAQRNGDWDKAERLYRRAYKAKKPNSVGTIQYANALLHREAYEETISVLRDYTVTQPGDPKAWEMLAFCYEKTGQPSLAADARQHLPFLKK